MSNSKTIAKNTLFLYFRMLFSLVVSLYTSRVVLRELGIDGFGVYNLVGGIVVLFTFLNGAMSSATQRFLNIEIASKNIERIKNIFSVSFITHFSIGMIVILLGESVGLWFLNTKLNISSDYLYDANIVYQMSLLTTLVSFLRVPYNALIIAKERMSFFALLGVLEVIFKLIIVFIIPYLIYSKLIVYSVLILIVTIVINMFFYVYCKKYFREESSVSYIKDKKMFREIVSFSGWSLFGNVGVVASNQGQAMILNVFIGVVINAAIGIANQVNTAIYSFVSNLQVAFMPRITQSYAEGRMEEHGRLVLNGSKFSYYLMLIFTVPLILFTKNILELWLTEVPSYTIEFVQLILLSSLFDALSGPFWMSANAIGNIKYYQFVLFVINLMYLPIIYLILFNNYSPIIVMMLKVFISIMVFIFRYLYVKNRIHISLEMQKEYLFALFRASILCILLFVVGKLFLISYSLSVLLMFISVGVVVFLVFTGMYFYVFTSSERIFIIQSIKRKYEKNI